MPFHMQVHLFVRFLLHVAVCVGEDDCRAESEMPTRTDGDLMTPARLAQHPASVSWSWLTCATTARSRSAGPAIPAEGRAAPAWPRQAAWLVRPAGGREPLAQARANARITLAAWGITRRSEDIVLVLSEILANALRHTRPRTGRWPVAAGLLQPGPDSGVLCAASDPGPGSPRPGGAGHLGESGRGLHVVAVLSDQWGYTSPCRDGKVVWAVAGPPVPSQPQVPPRAPGRAWPVTDPAVLARVLDGSLYA
jgi:anti-sigma regulatory factor (Ser/Thr protein kinase)